MNAKNLKSCSIKNTLSGAISKGLINENQELSEDEIFSLIFKSGFSTRESVSTVSGRGVGMDVVQTAVKELKGSIKIKSKIGQGTSFIISLPLSLSIIQGMKILVDESIYIIPLSQLIETVNFEKQSVETSTQHGRMINLRGEVIPVMSLSTLLQRGPNKMKKSNMAMKGIITIFQGVKVSFEVDEIIGQQEVVIKKLGKEMEGIPGVFGGAILGDGQPGLLLNLHDFLDHGGIDVAI
ncbi:MAG: hypothetical protein HON90_08285 [Halobacteriovoraceae bacterium]|jgi:two-component system, chemotaxis family, sensor kinase CheA|nr:hypothetical protein [Halobacteriovoraceae bacterium]